MIFIHWADQTSHETISRLERNPHLAPALDLQSIGNVMIFTRTFYHEGQGVCN